jgi:cullin-associated NEDD8-dissociated protein 1
MAALADVNEIKVLGLMLLLRLGQLAPASVVPRLDEVAEAVRGIMKDMEVKEDTIKQDLERKGTFTPFARPKGFLGADTEQRRCSDRL